ncbi:TPA: hypothetical protein QCI71_002959 [Enterobacter chuandaensis]|uniref:hypothetical protein n=1 Tax=Enterobacter nematophilus TaxID=2994648 RepID=UPI0032FB53A9|nr:hypothetical protein [Enterobacter chuandaensis]
MKKRFITTLTLAAILSSPAHAISEKYRAQLERSGCTQVTDGNGCDIHKTKAQNAAAAQKSVPAVADFQPYVGTWQSLDQNGKAIDTFTVTRTSVKTRGHLVEQARVDNGRLTFRVQAAEFNLLPEGFGSWLTSTQSGAIKRH